MSQDGETADIALIGVYAGPDEPEVGTLDQAVDQVLDDLAPNIPPEPDEPQELAEDDDLPRLNMAHAYDSPERLAEYDAETVRLINAANQDAKEASEIYEEKKQAAKQAKQEWEASVKLLGRLIDERKANRGQPVQQRLFDDDGNPLASAEVKTGGHWAAQDDIREPSEVPAPAPVEDEAWKAVPLSELVERDGLPQKVADLLAAADHKEKGPMSPILTMGDLANYSAPESSGWVKKLTDIRGIGPQKEEAISEATAKFWTRWNATRTAHADHATDAGAGGAAPADGPCDSVGQPGGAVCGDALPDTITATITILPCPSECPAPNDPNCKCPSCQVAAAAALAEEADPVGYTNDNVKRVADRMRGQQRKPKG